MPDIYMFGVSSDRGLAPSQLKIEVFVPPIQLVSSANTLWIANETWDTRKTVTLRPHVIPRQDISFIEFRTDASATLTRRHMISQARTTTSEQIADSR